MFNAKKHIEHPKKIHELPEKDDFVKYKKDQYVYDPDDLDDFDDERDDTRQW